MTQKKTSKIPTSRSLFWRFQTSFSFLTFSVSSKQALLGILQPGNMATSQISVAIAGAGDLAKYVVEECIKQKLRVLVLSRSRNDWFANKSPDVTMHITDYSIDSIVQALDANKVTCLFSTLNCFTLETYLPPHVSMLEACKQSKSCKRFSPAYFCGNIDEVPGLPRFYKDSREGFLKTLASTSQDIEWTTISHGWFMDYAIIFAEPFNRSDKSYLKALPGWSIDMMQWKGILPGTGDERASFTSARDVGKAIASLATTSTPWPRHTYISGEDTTWNKLADKLEQFYDRKLVERSYRSMREIKEGLALDQEDMGRQLQLQLQEWTVAGGQGLPINEVERQRIKYFKDIRFESIDDFLEHSKGEVYSN
ncbi:hypothetical protein VHEMI05483 [[Torrubiella] hemipterigena]|uniref:Uncharacterized protein n=1 Tax=[Torrubiella] hemipterigena TaxID=1531966 RepID=A0A0A1T4C0_9HYPO|nr:hypothetical protein VHEMI05483 [[Torrubiella] hemipterigena]